MNPQQRAGEQSRRAAALGRLNMAKARFELVTGRHTPAGTFEPAGEDDGANAWLLTTGDGEDRKPVASGPIATLDVIKGLLSLARSAARAEAHMVRAAQSEVAGQQAASRPQLFVPRGRHG